MNIPTTKATHCLLEEEELVGSTNKAVSLKIPIKKITEENYYYMTLCIIIYTTLYIIITNFS